MPQLLINLLRLQLFKHFTELINENPSMMRWHTTKHEVYRDISFYEDEMLSNH